MGCTTLPRLGSRVRIPSSAPRAFAGQRSFGAAHARFGCMRSRAQAAVRPRAGGELAGTHERPSLRVRKHDPSSSVSDDRVARLAGGRGCGHVGIGDDSVHRSRRFDRALPGRRRRRGRRPPARALHGAAPGDRAHGRYRGQDDRRRVDGLVPGGGGRDRRCGGDAAGSRRAESTRARRAVGDAGRHQRGRRVVRGRRLVRHAGRGGVAPVCRGGGRPDPGLRHRAGAGRVAHRARAAARRRGRREGHDRDHGLRGRVDPAGRPRHRGAGRSAAAGDRSGRCLRVRRPRRRTRRRRRRVEGGPGRRTPGGARRGRAGHRQDPAREGGVPARARTGRRRVMGRV